jgi:hypothetical protein
VRVAVLYLSFVPIVDVPGKAVENSPFYLPIRGNDLAALRQIIAQPGPNALDARGNSPLMYAARRESIKRTGPPTDERPY